MSFRSWSWLVTREAALRVYYPVLPDARAEYVARLRVSRVLTRELRRGAEHLLAVFPVRRYHYHLTPWQIRRRGAL